MCPFCGAHRDGDLTWNNFWLLAPWLSTCRDHPQFLRDMELSRAVNFQRGRRPFAFFALLLLAPYFQWEMVKVDWMHAADLGVLTYLLGEVFWSLLVPMAGATGGRIGFRSGS